MKIVNIADCPFIPDHCEGKKVRFIFKNFAICY